MMFHTPEAPVDLAKIVPEFARLAKTTVRLHPRSGTAAVDHSKIGGLFLWPKGEAWPTPSDTDLVRLVPVLQLRKEDAPELGFPGGTDLFQLLWDPRINESTFGPTPYAYWRKRADISDPIDVVPNPSNGIQVEDDNLPQPCIIHPERVTEYPDVFDVSDDMPELMAKLDASPELRQVAELDPEIFEEPNVVYQYLLSTCPGTKVCGYPEWKQSPQPQTCDCGGKMEYILTISYDEWDGGTWRRWLPIEEQERYINSSDVESSHLRTLFDANLNVFICRECPGWPIKGILQS
jgi:hypothetical protein